MLVFIDESGCSGFKLARGSDAVFAIGMVIFDDPECARRTERSVAEYRERWGHVDEIKFSRSGNKTRDRFFSAIGACPFSIRALVVDKSTLGADAELVRSHERFYSFFVRQLVRSAAARLSDVGVNIDGSGSRQFQRAMKQELRRELPGRVRSFRLVDSHRHDLIQLTDMCIGAIARAFRPGVGNDRWFRMLDPRIEDVSRYR